MMYLEISIFLLFVFFAIQDIKTRQIKVYWFVFAFTGVLIYKFIAGIDILSDLLMFGISSVFIVSAYISKLFGAADLIGILLFCFAIPWIGPFPSGISLLIVTIFLQTIGITLSNISYNVRDLINDKTLFHDVPKIKRTKIRLLFWSLYARRRRNNDLHILSAQHTNNDGTVTLSIKRGNKVVQSTKYVFSGHPQFAYLTVSYFLIWFASLAF